MKTQLNTLITFLLLFIPTLTFSQENASLETRIDSLNIEMESLKQKLIIKDSPFKLAIGASFDFLSGTSPTDLYYDINYFIPSLWNDDSSSFFKRIGVDFLFKQTRVFGDSTQLNLLQDPKAFSSINADTLLAEQYSLQRTIKTRRENLGIFIDPTFKLRPNLYLVGHLEGVVQKETVIHDDIFMGIDSTITIPINSYIEPTNKLRNVEEGLKSSPRQAQFYGFYGAGILFDFTIKNINIRLKPILGIVNDNNFETKIDKKENRKGFYYMTLQIREKNTGIKLGGAIRNTVNLTYSNRALISPAPQYSIFLSKEFSLKKLGEFINSK